jgi:hypothetical protein
MMADSHLSSQEHQDFSPALALYNVLAPFSAKVIILESHQRAYIDIEKEIDRLDMQG